MAKENKPTGTASAAKAAPAQTTAPAATAAAPEAPKAPETVELKAIADKIGKTPRECRVILRKVMARTDEQKRSRWSFLPSEVAGVIARIKKYDEDKAKEAAEKAAAEKKAAEEAAKAETDAKIEAGK